MKGGTAVKTYAQVAVIILSLILYTLLMHKMDILEVLITYTMFVLPVAIAIPEILSERGIL